MDELLFFEYPLSQLHADNKFIAHIPFVKGKEALLHALYNALHFPAYFGYNWDALNDCLTDLSWIDDHAILLIHNELPELSVEDMEVYIKILLHTIDRWRNDYVHSFAVAFPSIAYDAIRQYV